MYQCIEVGRAIGLAGRHQGGNAAAENLRVHVWVLEVLRNHRSCFATLYPAANDTQAKAAVVISAIDECPDGRPNNVYVNLRRCGG